MLHLNGDVGQWLVASFNREDDIRNRPAEFGERTHIPAAVLIQKLAVTLQEGATALSRLTEADLLATYEIQGNTVTGLAAVYQVVEHFGLHYGQIIYITKMLLDKDLGFYRELDQTGYPPKPGH